MFKEGEQHNNDQEIFDGIGEDQILPEDVSFEEELNEEPFLEERINDVMETQDRELASSEAKANRATLSGLRKWIGVVTVMGSSLLAVGCNSGKPHAEKPNNLEVESKQNGSMDNKHKVEQKKVKEYKTSKRLKKTAVKTEDNNIFKIEE